MRLTNRSFYQVQSLDASVFDDSSSKAKILISTTEYPIGDVFEEFIVGETG